MATSSTIPITCTCGAVADVPAPYAGRMVACKVCGQQLKVPGAKVVAPVMPPPVTVVVPVMPPKPAPPAAPASRPATLDDLYEVLQRIAKRLLVFEVVFVWLPLIGLALWIAILVFNSAARSP